MQSIKTAISVDKSLFEQAEGLAKKLKVSRSRLYGLALEDYVRRQQNQELLKQINAAHAGDADVTEKTLRKKARRTQRRMVKGEW